MLPHERGSITLDLKIRKGILLPPTLPSRFHNRFPTLLGLCSRAISCGESLQDSSPTRVPANQPRSARIHSWRRAARRRVPSDPFARGEQIPRFAW
jgi:hypothetical protein